MRLIGSYDAVAYSSDPKECIVPYDTSYFETRSLAGNKPCTYPSVPEILILRQPTYLSFEVASGKHRKSSMQNFTPVTALIGGLLIGVATLAYLVLTGRYAGLSGIVRSVAFGDPDRKMDALFIAGLILAGFIWSRIASAGPSFVATSQNLALVGVGGAFVGFGTTLGRGCTSGHGVCGLGRLSTRSLAAVLTFIATGIVTVFAVRQITGHA